MINSALAAQLEAESLAAWPGVEELRLGAWRLLFGDGLSRRANSVSPLGPPGLPLDPAVAACEQAYAARGLAACFKLSPACEPALQPLLLARAYEFQPGAWMMGVRLCRDAAFGGALADSGPPLFEQRVSLEVNTERDDARPWLDAAVSCGAIPPDKRNTFAAIIARTRAPWRALCLRDSGDNLAVGRLVLTPPHAGILNVAVHPDARRRGHGELLTRALLDIAREHACPAVWLQVSLENQPARRLYERLGFTPLYRYDYWRRTRKDTPA